MKTVNTLFLLIAMLFSSSSLFAQGFDVDGIYYNITSSTEMTVEVTNDGDGFYEGGFYYPIPKYSGSVSIPGNVTYEGSVYRVTRICGEAFYGCSGLTSIEIPNSVTSIGDDAFYGCSRLTSVHISDLEAWCKIEFSYSYSNPLFYADHLYLNGEEIKDLVIPNSVESIGSYAFRGCSGLTSVTIGNSVESIGYDAFAGCSGLTSIEIPNSVTSIGSSAFCGCSGLTSIEIPNSVTSIEDYAFSGCSGLTSIEIPNSVTSIGIYAFAYCSGLTSIEIPNSVTSIGIYAFNYCI